MCGITGIYAFNQSEIKKLTKIEQATNLLRLRGPNSGNIYNDSLTALGHRRLSIIDTSQSANQPMHDATNRYWIVFNGEIFNYKDLSIQYLTQIWEKNGPPKTNSDTEVLLNLLIHYGTKCLSWLSGFFAFAFYDSQTRELLVARDRYGKKPLVYTATENYFCFASEIKSLLAYDLDKHIDLETLYMYLQLNYVPPHLSMLKGVEKLKPGHFLQIKNGEISTHQYYQLSIKSDCYNQFTYEEAQKELVKKMDHAVQERLISDVPLGAFLSGGIDSSVVVALASQHTKHLNTFSIGYKDNPFFDETSYAQLVAKKYATEHTVFSLTNNDFLQHVYEVLDYLDEPYADSSAIPMYILCQHTKNKVTVALSGDGGDEVFSGYNKHAAEWKIRNGSLLNQLVKLGYPIWQQLPRSHNNKITNIFRQLHRFAEGAKLSTQDRYWRWASMSTPQQIDPLLSSNTLNNLSQSRLNKEKSSLLSAIKSDDFNEILLTDMNLVLGGDMLVKVDMMSMANSLEVRSPFLDYQVVDFAFGLPTAYKINASMKKRILQDAFRPMLPEEIYNRPKHGFEIPLLGWMRNELWGLINDDLLSKSFIESQGIFNVEGVEQLKKKLHSNNPENSHGTIWALIVFQYWWKKYFI